MSAQTPLAWSMEVGGFRKASGARGTYRLRHLGDDRWRLTGVGHDGLSMLALPPEGRLFSSLKHAVKFADGLDRAPAEAEMSGS